MGQRIAKHIGFYPGRSAENNSNTWEKPTYYLRDAQGNVLSVHNHKVDSPTILFAQKEKHIHGSSRIGTDITETGLIAASIPDFTATQHHVGNKYYELSNHLGNVMAVVTDRKITVQGANITCFMQQKPMTDFYIPNVVSYSDYYPGGMLMPDRNDVVNSYRFGFGGHERDDEIKGAGNSINFTYRMHDPRLGRFFAVAPLAWKYPYNSPYAFSENRLIDGIELEGLEYVRADAKVSKDVDNGDGTYTKTESTFGAEFGDLFNLVNIDGIDYYKVDRDIYQDNDGKFELFSSFPMAKAVWDRPYDKKYEDAYVPYGSGLECFDYACQSAKALGNLTPSGYNNWAIQMYNDESTAGLPVTDKSKKEGMYFINKALEKGTTVVVGLDYRDKYEGNTDKTTDHFVYVSGSGWDDATSRPFIIVMDNARISETDNKQYKLYWNGNFFESDEKSYLSTQIKLTQVRMSPSLMAPSDNQSSGDKKTFN
ncbi:MAG: hypothetical protein ACK4K0_01125 [Flavobacteriales bacterium]